MNREEIYRQLRKLLKSTESDRQIQQWAQIYYEDCILKNEDDCPDIKELAQRLEDEEPIQYIVHNARFYDLDLYVDRNVLIPRPETEELVFFIEKHIQQCEPGRLLDIGTGSGCIPLLLKKRLPQWDISAVDISAAAINVAEKNKRNLGLDINIIQADLLDLIEGENTTQNIGNYDVIVSNPPYIPMKEIESLEATVKNYEPELALAVEDENPCAFYAEIARYAQSALKDGGHIFCELHPDYAERCADCFSSYQSVRIYEDMQGKQRFLHVQ